MAHIQHVTRSNVPLETAQPIQREVVREDTEIVASGPTVIARIVWFVAGVLLTLLAFRFILALLGANPDNAFANFIYTTSHPFVAPFFSLFNYDIRNGVSHFETYTLVAMAVYAIVAAGLARLFTLHEPEPRV